MTRFWGAAAAVAAMAGSGAAQPPSPAAPWAPLWSAPYCTVSIADAKKLALSIWYVPGSNGVEIYFSGVSGLVPDPANVGHGPTFEALQRMQELSSAAGAIVEMGAGKRPIPVTLLGTQPSVSRVIGLAMSSEDFFGNFAGASELTVRQRNASRGMSFSGAAEAMDALRQCADARLKQWGVDGAALRSLKRRPVLRLDSWLTFSDYPKDALAQKQGGAVVVRLTTDESGKVTSCAIVLSSGVKSLDDVTCRLAVRRARYKPAIGADGRRVAATFTNYVKFDPLM